MSARRLFLFLLALVVLGSACGRTLFFPRTEKCVFDADCPTGLRCVNQECTTLDLADGGPLFGKKRFGEPCDAGVECGSTLCVAGPVGAFCSQACDGADAGCPSAYDCKRTPADGGRIDVCAVPQPLLCQSCATDLECGATGGDRCVTTDGGTFCARDCTFEGCPAQYACTALPDGTKQCIPEGRTCDCLPETVGLQKSCFGVRNAFGRCVGNQVCQADGGFSDCAAPAALAESCNGADDDCNGAIDDLVPTTCERTSGNVTCRGLNACFASAGLVCTARPPAAEACNYEDDDCDGEVDEGFASGVGPLRQYVTPQHCGACNRDCTKIIPHAVTTSCSAPLDVPTCFVSQCEPGFFPYADGRPGSGGAATMCLALPDTLCSPCQFDEDCVGPGSRCLTVDGARVCGRDCGSGSPYGTSCPAGYACQANAGAQCLPTSGTCSCTSANLGSTRACRVTSGAMTCSGFSTCAAAAPTAAWSSCDVATFNPEICDARDNNCDMRIDEGFLNQATGRYEAPQHCGFCNNDCTKYFSPTLQHTTGVCDLAPTLPRCTMGPCLTETVGGTTFEWVNVNAQQADGCECRRVQGNLALDLPDRLPANGNAASWVDENCDGIDGVIGDAIFVSAAAAPGGNGTRTAPLTTIAAGVAAQQAQGRRYVLVAQGLYRENVRLFDGAQVFGGYSQDFLSRDVRLNTTTWEGVAPTGTAVGAVHAESLGAPGVARETVVSGFTLTGWDATAAATGANGQASIAVYLRDVGPRFVLQGNDVFAGRGGTGGRGATGTQGFGRQGGTTTLNGQRGQNSLFFPNGTCAALNHRNGGTAGVNAACVGADGSPGGNVICPVYTFMGNQGAQQMYQSPLPTSRNGAGGFDWSYDTLSSPGCNHVTESGFPTSIQQHDGEDGKPGADGTGGVGGPGAATRARFGSIVNGRWTPSPVAAVSGQGGLTAQGGGGGGAGGGVARFTAGGCQGWEIGATGGGAGAGGCGGTGGAAGGAGGASLAVLITFTTPSMTLPSILNNRIQRGQGGTGGDGGFGGAGGLGGAGGFGGGQARWSSSVGGKGGEGGNGGPGGGGGGGAGGPSFAVYAFNVATTGFSATNTFLTAGAVDTGGLGGAGGSSPGGSAGTGTPGARGASGNLVSLGSCAATCLGGTCDANGVCIPN